MKRLFRTENAALLLSALYSITLLWMLLDWKEGFGTLPWWGVTLQLPFGFALIAWAVWLYTDARRRRTSKSLDSK